MARTHVGRLLEFLKQNSGKAPRTNILEHFGWDDEKLDRVIEDSGYRIKPANMGRVAGVAQVGFETGALGAVPLYADVCRVLESTWQRAQGWQVAMALDTSLKGGRSTGVWTRPDCVLVYYPARRARLDEDATLASYEIEAPGKFDIKSVYEAHAHGHGADFSWVVFYRDHDARDRDPVDDWKRIDWAARTCGIGLISVTNCGNASTWRIERKAVRRKDGRRDEFVRRALARGLRAYTALTLKEMKAGGW